MESSRRSESPEFTFCEDGGRPLVTKSEVTSKFQRGQQVTLNVAGLSQGPYKIKTVSGTGRYTLSTLEGQMAKDGQEVEEKDLQAV